MLKESNRATMVSIQIISSCASVGTGLPDSRPPPELETTSNHNCHTFLPRGGRSSASTWWWPHPVRDGALLELGRSGWRREEGFSGEWGGGEESQRAGLGGDTGSQGWWSPGRRSLDSPRARGE